MEDNGIQELNEMEDKITLYPSNWLYNANEVLDNNQLSKMAKRTKEILEVEEIEVLADKGYYNSTEIKECVDSGITPYVADPEVKDSKSSVIYHTQIPI